MVRKLKSLEAAEEASLIEAVRNSAHLIWQAGLGAFSRAQDEGGELFARLVQQGSDLQKQTQQLADVKGSGVTDSMSRLAENVGRQASGSWERIEKVFEDRVSRSLRSLGVPTRDDLKAISRQLDDLSASIQAMARKEAAAAKSADKAPSAKRAAKPASRQPKAAVKSAVAKPPSRTAARKQARPAAGQP